jgi:hypothetical protein
MGDGSILWRRFSEYPLLHPELRREELTGTMPRTWDVIAAEWRRASVDPEGRGFAVIIDDEVGEHHLYWAAEEPRVLARLARHSLERLEQLEDDHTPVTTAEHFTPEYPEPGGIKALNEVGFRVAHWWLDYRLEPLPLLLRPGANVHEIRAHEVQDVLELCRQQELEEYEWTYLDQVRAWVERPNHALFVAYDGGRLMAYAAVRRYTAAAGRQRLFIRALRTTHEGLRDGWAELALTAALIWGRERGCADAMLWVERDDTAYRGLYDRMGFAPHGEASIVLRYHPLLTRS